ncbi:MAG: SulP family inorganic anion transporter [Chlamydiales bacterium]|nr:SulP family inorganic anion transporter [Chlamydiales bacterium]
MTKRSRYEDISFQPLREDLRALSWQSLKGDLSAALTVALLTVPQVMAYALIAGLPLTCGLFGALFATALGAIFGSSRFLVIGPTNAVAILVQAGTAEILYTYYRGVTGDERDILAVQILAQLALLVGIFQLIAAVFRLGRLTQFVSSAVIVGYMTGTAVALVVSQSFIFLGMEPPQGVFSLFQKVTYIFSHVEAIHWPTVWIGIACLVFLIGMKRVNSKIPAAALMLLLSGLAVYVFHWSIFPQADMIDPFAEGYVTRIQLVGNAGQIFGILPVMAFPQLDPAILNKLVPIAFAIALLSTLETSSVAKTIASKSGESISINQEVMALGIANIASGLVGALPAAGSPSRTSLNYNNGATTRFAAFFSACCVGLMVFAFGYFISFIPLAALAALLLLTSFGLWQPRNFMLCLKATRSDAFVLVATVLACVFFSVDTAFYIGIVLSITFYLNKASTPNLREYSGFGGQQQQGRQDGVRVIDVHGELFFGAADLFQATLRALAKGDSKTRAIILRLKHARDLDATACLALLHLYRFLKSNDIHLILCSIPSPVWKILENSGVAQEIGNDRLFLYNWRRPGSSEQDALACARRLIQAAPGPVNTTEAVIVTDADQVQMSQWLEDANIPALRE